MQISRRAFSATALGACVLIPGAPLAATTGAHDFRFTSIEGDPLAMSDYAGRTVLVVNTASRCGFTHQYEGLQALYDRYRDRGLVVLGVPSNDFRQELSSAAEVKQFCELTYGIDFPMTDIERVAGADAHPLFRWMAAQSAAPSWNFNKYLIGPDGAFLGRFGSSTAPDDARLIALIEDSLS